MTESVPEICNLPAATIAHGVPGQTLKRAQSYLDQGRVLEVNVAADRQSARALVRGSALYSVRVFTPTTQHPAHPNAPRWDSTCSCPVGRWCKHAVAVLLDMQAAPEPAPELSGWADVFGDLIRGYESTSRSQNYTPIGVLVTKKSKPASRYGATQEVVQLRLIWLNENNKWVKTGVDWSDLSRYGDLFPYGTEKINPDIKTALLDVVSAYRITRGAAYYSDLPKELPAHELGPRWLELLQQLRTAGAIVTGRVRGDGEVTLTDREIGYSLQVLADGNDRLVMPSLSNIDVFSQMPIPIGDPIVGFAHFASHQVTLAKTARPITHREFALLNNPTRIPAAEWDQFAVRYLPRLRHAVPVDAEAGIDIPETLQLTLEVTLTHQGPWQAETTYTIRYGSVAHGARFALSSTVDVTPRDLSEERDLVQSLYAALPDYPDFRANFGRTVTLKDSTHLALDVAELHQWLTKLAALENVEVTYDGDQYDYQEVIEAPEVSLGVTEDPDPTNDWFDLDIAVTIAGEVVPVGELIVALTQKEERMFLPSGKWFSLNRPELEPLRLALLAAKELEDKETQRLRISPAHAGYWQELLGVGVVDREAARWQERVSALVGASVVDAKVPASVQATLREYQQFGFEWLATLIRAGLGGILADDMGLGKTLQILAAVSFAREEGLLAGPVLVVAPTSVVGNWQREAATFCPDLTVVTVPETTRKARIALAERIAGADVVVTSYAVLRLDETEFRGLDWSMMVLDEAQFAKNFRSKTYKAIRRVPAQVRIAVTGTPLENSLMDLWSMLSMTAPGLFPDPEEFKTQWARPVESGLHPELLAALRRRVAPLMLRRTKELVARDLPPKQEQVLSVDLHPKHRSLYEKHFHRERQRILGLLAGEDTNRFAVFKALTALRQMSLDPSLVDEDYVGVAPSAKVEVLLEHIQGLVTEGHRALVFSQFTGFLAVVQQRLEKAGVGFSYLDGSTRNRDQVIADFREGAAPVFLISLKAGGFGLTLTEADYVFVLDPWWNPAAEAQAIDRAHRIGQQRPVHVYRMVSAGTIEEKVVALQEKKRELFANVVDGGAGASGVITDEDIRRLLA